MTATRAARGRVGRFVTADGTALRYAESPATAPPSDGEPTLVLAHGWSQDLRTWDRVVDDLRAAGVTCRILRHDHRGHGGSDAARRGTATVGRIADDLAELLAALVPSGPLVLGGHSMGGMTLMALAERHPDLVARRVRAVAFVATASDDMADLTLALPGLTGQLVARAEHAAGPLIAALGHRAPGDRTGPHATAPRRDGSSPIRRVRTTVTGPAVRALVFGRHARTRDVATVIDQALAADPRSVVGFRASIAEHRRRSSLAALRGTPSVVLVGDRDRLCPPHHARAIAAELPDAELVLLPGAGHMINLERSVEVAAHIQGLIEACTAAPAGTTTPATATDGPPREVLVVGALPGPVTARNALRAAGVDDVATVDGMSAAWWDEETRTWTVDTDRGEIDTRFLVLASAGSRPEPVPDVQGRDGRTLARRWRERGVGAHLGVTVTDFPNLFLLRDPENPVDDPQDPVRRAAYVAQAIRAVHEAGCTGLDVRAEAVAQRAATADEVGPGPLGDQWAQRELRTFRPADFEIFGRAGDRPVTPDGG